jgi:cytochrome c
MASQEANKIAGAILMSGLIAMASGFIARSLVHPVELKELAFAVEKPDAPAAGSQAAAAPAEIPPVAPLLAKADLAVGEAAAKKCAACHTFDKGGPNRVGPNLWDVVGRKPGSHPGFAYSKAMASVPEEWNYEHLNKYLANPKAEVPGNKMAFAGIPKIEERAAVIAWLRSKADAPKPLP